MECVVRARNPQRWCSDCRPLAITCHHVERWGERIRGHRAGQDLEQGEEDPRGAMLVESIGNHEQETCRGAVATAWWCTHSLF